MDIVELILLFVKAFIIVNVVMVVFALMTWAERRVIGFFQFRLGPNRSGPFGILQPIADLVKLARKENFAAGNVSRTLHLLAPAITLFFALGVVMVVPFAPGAGSGAHEGMVNIFGWWTTPHIAADLPTGVLIAVALGGLSGYGVIIGGWASNSKFALLGALRACAQLISYEVSLTLAILPVVLMSESLQMTTIASAWQEWSIYGWHPWFIMWMPIAFVIFSLSALAEANRAPFDHAEAEQELVGGFHTEYGGMRYAVFANAEYIHMLTICSLGVTFFLGSWHGPWAQQHWGLGVLYFLLKLGVFLFVFIWIRATVPRLRYDRLMRFGWKVMLPAATVQLIVVAAFVSQPGNDTLKNVMFIGQWVVVLAMLAYSRVSRTILSTTTVNRRIETAEGTS